MLRLIADLRVKSKLMLLGATALTIIAVLLTLLVQRAEAEMAVLDAEVAGLEPSKALLEWVRLTQQHRGLSGNVLGGKADVEPQRAARQTEADRALQRFAATAERLIDQPRLRTEAQRIAAEWAALSQAVVARQVDGTQSFARHSSLIAAQIELHDRVADHFGLTLDPEPATYFTIIATLQQMPRMVEMLGQARARGSVMLAKKTASANDRTELAALVAGARTQWHDAQTNLGKAFEAGPAIGEALEAELEKAVAAVRAAVDLAQREVVDAQALSHDADSYFKTLTTAIDATFALKDRAAAAIDAALMQRRSTARRLELAMLGASAALVAFGLWLGIMIARSIAVPAAAARDAARRIAAGDLGTSVPAGSKDEMGQLLEAMLEMQASLVKVVGEVRGNADSVATASAQIAQGNADLSQRTEEQASALEQTAATMQQLGATVRQNADNARQANQLAQGASSVAVKGGDVVGRVVDTMKGISESSRKIAEIIGTIDGIAFQTNILALNAAVEAARAGEQGRGFAVVAGEVRLLAQRSADAAKEIKALITASVERVDHGTALVDEAGKTMDEVVSSIKRVSDIVGEISAASAEQSSGVQQVGEAVGQMDQVTQQNAALVEESAAAAESLKGQAAALVQAVSVFKLAHGVHGAAPTAAPAAWNGIERRGPERATNVTRPRFDRKAGAAPKAEPAPARTGTDDGEWTSF